MPISLFGSGKYTPDGPGLPSDRLTKLNVNVGLFSGIKQELVATVIMLTSGGLHQGSTSRAAFRVCGPKAVYTFSK